MPGYVPRTWGPTIGCTKISLGCKNCYFFELHDRRHKAWREGRWPTAPKQYHQPASVMQIMPDRFEEPYSWRKPSCVFVNSQSDLFHEEIPDDVLIDLFRVMVSTPQHRYLILTKRPERMRDWLRGHVHPVAPNIWLGVTCEHQAAADERIPLLLQTPAAIRFLSVEPMLGPVDLLHMTTDAPNSGFALTDGFGRWDGEGEARIHWVICGFESGPRKRAHDLAYAYSLRFQCAEARVPFFMKQIDKVKPIPADLMIRQFPVPNLSQQSGGPAQPLGNGNNPPGSSPAGR